MTAECHTGAEMSFRGTFVAPKSYRIHEFWDGGWPADFAIVGAWSIPAHCLCSFICTYR